MLHLYNKRTPARALPFTFWKKIEIFSRKPTSLFYLDDYGILPLLPKQLQHSSRCNSCHETFQQRCLEKIQCPKKHPVHVEKELENIIAAFKSSGGTKRQQIKEGTYEQVNLACYKWLQIKRSENIQSNEQFNKKKPLV